MPRSSGKHKAEQNTNTSVFQASVKPDYTASQSLLPVQGSSNMENLKPFSVQGLILNPKVEIEQLRSFNPGPELEEEEDDDEEGVGNNNDDDEEEEELSEEQKQQMQQLTSIVNNAFKRADLQRSAGLFTSDIPESSSALGELEFIDKKPVFQEMSRRNSIPGTRPGSPFAPVPLTARMSSVESQSTHTSDFHPQDMMEDGSKLLETLSDAPDSLEKALTLNQALQRRFSNNIERLEAALKQNLQRQLALHDEEDEERVTIEDEKHLRNSDTRYFLRISSFCRPYFKTKTGMPAPMNEDAKFRIENGYLDMYQTRQRPWSRKEDRHLQLAVLAEAKENQLQQMKSKENAIKRKMKNVVVKNAHDDKEVASMASEAVQCQQEMKDLQRTPLRNISVPPAINLDWIRIAAQASDGHRTPYECQHRWYALLSPNISQKNFSEKDDIAIQAAVRQCVGAKPDWVAIASQLSEPRSAFQVFRRYQSFIHRALNPVKWSASTNAQLVQLVQHLRVGEYVPWNQVHQRMPGFTRTQLQGQWKKLNPGRRKGPFSRHEDSLFLRGILKFGLNFQQIVQFMPQRNKEQLKDRFRRILVAVFMTEWTREMDEELRSLSKTVEPSHLNTSFWRRLAAVPGFANSGKDAAMLRLRYLILQLWQDMSLSDETPPSLFPVTITTCPEEIALVNKHFQKADIVELREMIDKINAGKDIRAAMGELEKRRVRLHQQHDQHTRPNLPKDRMCAPLRLNHLHMHHLHQQAHKSHGTSEVSAVDGRSIAVRMPSVLSWPEQLILEFFLPARQTASRPADLSSDCGAVGSLQLLMRVLQLRPMPPESCDAYTLEDLNITEAEVGLAHLTANQHTCKTGDQATVSSEHDLPCVWCSGDAVPETIPLLPPSAATVGALQNLLIHRRTLRHMANKCFVLHRYKGPDLYRQRDRPRSRRSLSDPLRDYEEGRLPMPGRVGKIHITSGMPLPRRTLRDQLLRPKGLMRRNVATLNVVKERRKKKNWTKRSIIDIYKSFKSGKNISQYQSLKKSEGGDENKASGSATPSSAAVSSTKGRAELPSTSAAHIGKRRRDNSAGTSASRKPCKKRGRVSYENLPESWAKHFPPPEPSEEVTAESSDSEDEAPVLTTEEFRAHAEADNLLWHRFLAIFLWPAIMSCFRPLASQEQQVEQQHEAMRRNNASGNEDDSQGIQGAASSILQEVAPPVQRRKRKRKASSGNGDLGSEASAERAAPKKVPTRISVRQKKARHVE